MRLNGAKAASTWLHNTSVAPKTTIIMKSSHGRNYGCGIIFALPKTSECANPAHALGLLGARKEMSKTAAEAALRQLLNSHAITLPLPTVAAVTDQSCPGDVACSDLLTILTVFAKSSSRVYMRDKEPNLASIVPGRRIVLVVPTEVKL